MSEPADHRARHSASDQNDVATKMIPRVVDDRPAKPSPARRPRIINEADDQTTVLPRLPSKPAPIPTPEPVAEPPAAEPPQAQPAAEPPKAQPKAQPNVYGSAATEIIDVIRPDEPGPAPAEPPADEPVSADDQAPKGVRVVPLRPVRTEEGYRSVYSDLTRTTFGTVVRTTSRAVGELLITFGLIVLLFAGYEIWGKSAIVDEHQRDLQRQLDSAQTAPTVGPIDPAALNGPKLADGAVIGKVYIPRMKKNWVIVQGVTPADIRYAPGHYPDTAMPGQIGNFSMAGHRTPAIFWDLDTLKSGDPLVVQYSGTWYVYKVVQSHVVTPTSVQVVAPVPNQPGVKPTQAMITLTTCNPKFNNYQRLIVHGLLDHTQPASAGEPAELKG